MSEAIVVAAVSAGSAIAASLLTAKVSGDKLRAEEQQVRRQEKADLEARFLNRERDLWSNANATINRQQADIERARKAHDAAVDELRELQDRTLELRASNAALQNTTVEQQKQIVRLEKENAHLKQKVKQVTIEHASTREDVHKLRTDLDAAIALWQRPDMTKIFQQRQTPEGELTR